MRHLSTDLHRRRSSEQDSAPTLDGSRGGRRWLSSFVPLSRRSVSSSDALKQSLQSRQEKDACILLPVRLRHPHLTPLFYEVRNRAWPDVIRRCQTRPHEAWVQEDVSGETPLHCACRFDPPADVVRSLIEAASTFVEEGLRNGDDAAPVGSAAVREVRNTEGATALHVACSHRASAACIRVLVEPVRSNVASASFDHLSKSTPRPTAALTKTGRTPLHYACMSFRGLDVDAFRTLLEATVADRAAISGTPSVGVAASIHCNTSLVEDLCFGAEFEDIEDVVDCDEDENDRQHAPASADLLTLRDSSGQAAIGLLFRRYRERVRCVIRMVEQNTNAREQASSSASSMNAAAQAVRDDLGELWEKARLIVSTMAEQQEYEKQEHHNDDQSWQSGKEDNEAFLVSNSSERDSLQSHCFLSQKMPSPHPKHPIHTARAFRIVHASVGLTGYGCPPEMVRLAASVHPNQVREMDEDGNLPIHIIAGASSYAHPDADAPELGGSSCDENNGGDDEGSLASIAAGSVASTVLSVYTGATSTANSLGTSQFCAPSNPRPFDAVMRILLRHYPEGAAVPHGITGELPLVMAARNGRRSWEDGMKSLLLAYPPALYGPHVRPPGLHACILGRVASEGGAGSCNEILLPVMGSGRDVKAFPFGRGRRQRQRKLRSRNKAAAKALGAVFELVKAQPNVIGGY